MKVNREKYEELKEGKPIPYCFEIKKGKQVLFYFGANHSRDPQNKQYSILRKYWKTFLKMPTTPKLVVVEGELRKVRKTQKEAVVSGSEGSVATILADKADIPIICPEPSDDIIKTAIWKKFSKDEIYYYDFAHLIDSWRRFNPRPDFREYMEKRVAQYSKRNSWEDFTLPKMKAVHKKLFGKTFSLKDTTFFNNITNPNRTDTIVNEVARFLSDMRDAEILKRLHTEWKAGKSLFITYGSGHAFLHEPILKKLFK